jgi:uracil-DNA glycosylase
MAKTVPGGATMNRVEIMKTVAEEVSKCQRCNLHHTRKRSVPGEGPVDAQVMLIGEGPGFYENEQGRPFVGQAGKFLGELLLKGGLKREEVFITNVVKCRPPENRDPAPDELAACGDYLQQQIDAINPRVIVTLGRFSMGRFFENAKISAIHGQAKWIGDRLIVAIYHPAAALHQPALKATLLNDFANLPRFLEQAAKAAQPKPVEPAKPPAVSIREPVSLFDIPVEPAIEDDNPPDDNTPATQLPLF